MIALAEVAPPRYQGSPATAGPSGGRHQEGPDLVLTGMCSCSDRAASTRRPIGTRRPVWRRSTALS